MMLTPRYVLIRIRHMPKFLAALCLAVLLAIVMTITSVVMYATSGVSSIDLSRPGYEQARKGLKTVDASKTFSPTGPLDGTVIDQFNQIYTSQTTQTRSFGGFNDTAIDDGNLGLTPGATQPSGSP